MENTYVGFQTRLEGYTLRVLQAMCSQKYLGVSVSAEKKTGDTKKARKLKKDELIQEMLKTDEAKLLKVITVYVNKKSDADFIHSADIKAEESDDETTGTPSEGIPTVPHNVEGFTTPDAKKTPPATVMSKIQSAIQSVLSPTSAQGKTPPAPAQVKAPPPPPPAPAPAKAQVKSPPQANVAPPAPPVLPLAAVIPVAPEEKEKDKAEEMQFKKITRKNVGKIDLGVKVQENNPQTKPTVHLSDIRKAMELQKSRLKLGHRKIVYHKLTDMAKKAVNNL